jgi:glycosyltransferase involved in cell wall biosynthesis
MNNKKAIIIPCYNEQYNIKPLINQLSESGYKNNILVINDGSSDETTNVVKQFKNITLIELPLNVGIGGAVKTGLIYLSRNDFKTAIKIDGDGQHPPDQIEKLLNALNQNKADIIVGSRFLEEEQEGFKSTLTRRIGISFLQKVCKLLTGQKITDPTSGFRAYNRKAIEFMAQHYPSFDYPEPEEIILAVKNDLRIKEVPVIMRERQHGKSSISAGNSIYYMIKVTLAMIFTALRQKEKITR